MQNDLREMSRLRSNYLVLGWDSRPATERRQAMLLLFLCVVAATTQSAGTTLGALKYAEQAERNLASEPARLLRYWVCPSINIGHGVQNHGIIRGCSWLSFCAQLSCILSV